MDAHVKLIAQSAELANRNQPGDWEFMAEFIDAELVAGGLMIVKKNLVEYAWKQSGQHVRMMEKAETEIERLRDALEKIRATFNKPSHLQGNAPSMIAAAALNTQQEER